MVRHTAPVCPRSASCALLALASAALLACTGDIEPGSTVTEGGAGGTPAGGAGGQAPNPGMGGRPMTAADGAIPGGLRRLTNEEYEHTILDLLGDSGKATALPAAGYAFDENYTAPEVSATLVEAVELLARDVAGRLQADVARRDRLVGCKPARPDDETCARSFVERFGRRALRRPLDAAEVTRFLALHKTAALDEPTPSFYAGVDAVVRAFLQDPELIFRVEIGKPVDGRPGVHRLGPFEVATRLSYLLWGTTPSDALLDRAQTGKLATADGVREAATEMLADPRARARVSRFHALWLGYERLPHAAPLAASMKAETDALIARVLFEEKRPWLDLLRAGDTLADERLRTHYGLTAAPNAGGWVPYGASGRKGLLSHGSFLAIGAKFGDTSPTVRGKLIRERLLCESIAQPPANLMVNTDDPPAGSGSPCKWDRYADQRATSASCRGCHELTDLVGFGLENYDAEGRFRTHDRDRATGQSIAACPIAGEGEFMDMGKFKGPSGLADLLLAHSDRVSACAIAQLYRLAAGHYHLEPSEETFVGELATKAGPQFRFTELLLTFVSSEAFSHRREVMP